METKLVKIKEPNRRVQIELFENPALDNEKCILVYTKRLVDFKNRHITETKTLYSIGTATCIWLLLSAIFENSTVRNKDLLKEMSDFFSKESRSKRISQSNFKV